MDRVRTIRERLAELAMDHAACVRWASRNPHRHHAILEDIASRRPSWVAAGMTDAELVRSASSMWMKSCRAGRIEQASEACRRLGPQGISAITRKLNQGRKYA